MESFGRAKRVRIYLSEGDRAGHLPAHVALIQFLRKEGAQGASVFRGIEGFGASGEVHVSHLPDIAYKLPIIVEWIDHAERVERLMPQVRAMVKHGFITADDTSILLFEPHPVRMLAAAVTAADVMSREVTSVDVSTPIRQVVEAILGKPYRAVPVLDRGRVAGIITGSDLVERGGLGVRLNLLATMAAPERLQHLDALSGASLEAGAVMTRDPVCVLPGTPLTEVALLMARRRLKRLPVVDGQGQLLGVVSRYDLLRSAAGDGFEAAEEGPRAAGLGADAPISSVMRRDVPAVHPDTPLPETMQAVVSTRLNMAVVVDDARRVLGLVSDGALLERITPALRPGIVRSLMLRLPFAHPRQGELDTVAHARAHSAGELMSRGVPTVPPETRLSEAIARMLQENQKLLAVTGDGGVLLGVVDRADLLRGLAAAST